MRFLQQVEKYDSDSSGDCSEEEVGDEEEEDGARLVSAQYVSGCCRRFTDCVFCSALMLRLRHPFGLSRVFTDVARQLLERAPQG